MRIDAVLIRVSTKQQETTPQIANVELLLKEREVHIPERHWYCDTRSRRKPEKGKRFQELIKLVEQDAVGTIFVESQDRFGTKDAKQLFRFLSLLQDHGTALIDLKTGKDLTANDFATEISALVTAKKSEEELKDTVYRAMRGRLAKLKDKGSWPAGPAPFGFDKVYHDQHGKFLFRFRHETLGTGQVYFEGPGGELIGGPTGQPSPRSADRTNVIKLAPSTDSVRVQVVKDVFHWWTTESISLRGICRRLDERGVRIYTGPFAPTNLRALLTNPAYLGHTRYGDQQRAELVTFDGTGKLTNVEGELPEFRADRDCIRVENTHEAMIDPATFAAAAKKLAGIKERGFAPRDGRFYLKGLLFCGHCGKPLTCASDKGLLYYICPTYSGDKAKTGRADRCGYHKISHVPAEALILAKLAEIGVRADGAKTANDTFKLESELELLGKEADAVRTRMRQVIQDGSKEYVAELETVYGFKPAELRRLVLLAAVGIPAPSQWEAIRTAIGQLETKRVNLAKAQVAKLTEEHRALTLAWARADARQQSVLKAECQRIDQELATWEARTVPLTAQVARYRAEIAAKTARMAKLRAEWPAMEARARGEALRLHLDKVVIRWGKEWRKKRFAYPLLQDQIEWHFADGSKLSGFGSPMLKPITNPHNSALAFLALFLAA